MKTYNETLVSEQSVGINDDRLSRIVGMMVKSAEEVAFEQQFASDFAATPSVNDNDRALHIDRDTGSTRVFIRTHGQDTASRGGNSLLPGYRSRF